MIRFFVSSVFREMQDEREAIHRVVYPEIREYAREKGIYVDICDLRWGISLDGGDAEGKATEKIANICLNEIQQCRPYIITMIGKDYGTVPKDQASIKKAWDDIADTVNRNGGNLSKCNIDLSKQELKLSLTHWELEFAFLHENNPYTKALCLFKDVMRISKKTKKLKTEIKDAVDNEQRSDAIQVAPYRYLYNKETGFIAQLKGLMEKVIDEEASRKENQNWVEQEFESAKAYAEEKIFEFAGRDSEIKKFDKAIGPDDASVIGISGVSGIGKSSLMAYLYMNRQETCSFIACGSNGRSLNYRDVLVQILYFVNSCLAASDKPESTREPVDVNEAFTSVGDIESEIIKRINDFNKKSREKVIIFIDAVDKLFDKDMKHLFDFLCVEEIGNNSNVKIVLSQIESFCNDSVHLELPLKELSDDEQKSILRKGIFANAETADDPEYFDSIIVKNRTKSPLYLRIVIIILKMHIKELGGNSVKYNEIVRNLPEDIEKLCLDAFEMAAYYTDYKARYKNIIGLLALSVNGLAEYELEGLLKNESWVSADFARYRRYLDSFFRLQYDGRWNFEHDLIRKSVSTFLDEDESMKDKTIDLFTACFDNIDKNGDNDMTLEMMLREGLHLSMIKGDYELAEKVCDLHHDKEISMDRRRFVVQTLERLIGEGDYLIKPETAGEWFRIMAGRHDAAIVKLLRSLLELEYDEEYERRLPAMALTEKFLESKRLVHRRQLDKYMETIKDAHDRKFEFACLCAEYVSVLESIDEPGRATAYITFATDYFKKFFKDFNELTADHKYDQAVYAFSNLNAVLYTGNRVMNDMKKNSQNIIRGYKNGYIDLDELCKNVSDDDAAGIRSVDAFFISNTGQFFNGIEDYEEAFKWHMQSLERKTEGFVSLFKGQDAEKIEAVLNGLFDKRTIYDVQLIRHKDAWEKIMSYIDSKYGTLENAARVLGKWKMVATSYNTLGSDCYNLVSKLLREGGFSSLSHGKQSYIRKILNTGIDAWNIAFYMIEYKKLTDADRQRVQTGLRRLGTYVLGLTNSILKLDSEEKEMVEFVEDLVKRYIKNSILFLSRTR